MAGMTFIPLHDRKGEPFRFSIPDVIARQLHEIDLGAGGRIVIPEPVTNPDTRDQYLIRSLMDAAIGTRALLITWSVILAELFNSQSFRFIYHLDPFHEPPPGWFCGGV